MSVYGKLLGGFAALALVAAVTPSALAQDTQDDVVMPGDNGQGDVILEAPEQTQETVVPGGGDQQTVVVTTPRASPPVNQLVVEIGGGAATYSDQLGDQLKGGAGWTARAILGAKAPVGLELAYAGALNPIEGTSAANIGDFNDIGTDTALMTNQGEALARFNFAGPRAMVKPYVAGGANYTRMDSDTTLDNLDAIGFPLAAGLQLFPTGNFTVGARGEYKILTGWLDDNLPNGNQWGGMLSVGANF